MEVLKHFTKFVDIETESEQIRKVAVVCRMVYDLMSHRFEDKIFYNPKNDAILAKLYIDQIAYLSGLSYDDTLNSLYYLHNKDKITIVTIPEIEDELYIDYSHLNIGIEHNIVTDDLKLLAGVLRTKFESPKNIGWYNNKNKKLKCVYYISMGECYKIGITNNIYRRYKNLKTANPFIKDCRITKYFKGDIAENLETSIHEALSEYNVSGEWFRSCKESHDILYDMLDTKYEFYQVFK